jgi:glycosyltransferase involved in cell wall biosynthesis
MNRWGELNAAVQSCLDQTTPPDEILLVIDHNPELLERAAREIAGASVIANRSTKGLSGARNTGVASSTGDVVIFLDDDAYANEDWLERITAPFADPLIAGVSGWIVPHWETELPRWLPESFYWVLGCSYEGLPPSGATIRNPIGASMAMRRKVFTSVGGFTSGIGRIGVVPLGCEETELCIRYTSREPGDRFVLARDAVVHHRVPGSRLTWHYFWTRCWAEGLSKAAVTSLVGVNSGLAAERSHVVRALPRELWSSFRSIKSERRDAAIRSTLIVLGAALALAGYARGRVAVWRTAIAPGDNELEALMNEPSDNGDR